ncbi:MAG: hypothetical protein CMB29_04750 [Euryarchaeota archaeon]|nr:hypothetical protein [Euryarchaeota archaeon]
MGKTFRRGGSEKGNYSYGKSIRDKRSRNSKSSFSEDSYDYQSKNKANKSKRRFNTYADD